MNNRTFITKRANGEYSTAIIGDMIETCWFDNDGSSKVIDQTYFSLAALAEKHIDDYESKGSN